MTLQIIFGVAGFLLLVVALTGIILDKEGKPSILVTSIILRSVLGICGLGFIVLSVYIWETEVKIQGNPKEEIDKIYSELEKTRINLNKINSELEKTRINLNKSIGYVYEDSSNYLIRVAKLIGERSKLGCVHQIDKYQKNEEYIAGGDMCNALKLLMHPVTITATDGIHENQLNELIESLSEREGIPSYVTIGDKTNALNENLAIIYPDSVSKKTICVVRNKYQPF